MRKKVHRSLFIVHGKTVHSQRSMVNSPPQVEGEAVGGQRSMVQQGMQDGGWLI